MIEGIVITVVGGLILAGIILLIRSLADEQQREDLTERVKQATCRHQWEQISNDLGPNIVFVTADKERCRKCGARR